jgi:glycyl-tRNA synthetase beta chain
MPDFLLEIGCEEIPARMIDGACEELARRVTNLLKRETLGQIAKGLSTPRRLAVQAEVIERQPDTESWARGPSAQVAYKDGSPTRAAEAFAAKAGIRVEELKVEGGYLVASVTKKGRPAAEILAELLPKEISSVYWPKSMYWRKPNERFVRPVRWVVAMLDDEVIPLEVLGIKAGNQSRGHRILVHREILIPRAGAPYVSALCDANVLGRAEREQQIHKALDTATRTINGARWREDKILLDTVVNLTEFPSVILGSFDREFLELPEEVLVTVMRDHQKYFAVQDANGKLLSHFLAVLNTDGDPQGIIRHGHERVLRARFNDARFFWQTDQKHPLRERTEWLKHVTFQKDLGSYYEKTLRLQRLCSWLSEIIRQSGIEIRPGVIHKAAYLAKTDLTTGLVKEFTELQGIVGGLYAGVQELDRDMPDGTRRAIADAVYDHYKPESMEDSVPRTVEGAVLSIADKADSIAGMFALGLQPTGSKDPFALRRQANGIVKTIAEKKLPLSLDRLFTDARAAYKGSAAEQKFSAGIDYFGAAREFFRERLEFYLRDVLGFKYDEVNAVLAADADDVVSAVERAEDVAKVRSSPDFESISIAFKRMKNILQQAATVAGSDALQLQNQVVTAGQIAAEQARQVLKQTAVAANAAAHHGEDDAIRAEEELKRQVATVATSANRLRARGDYEQALIEISRLRPAIDNFFDKVMVMVEDKQIRTYRLALLQTILEEFSTIADFSEIVTEGKEPTK